MDASQKFDTLASDLANLDAERREAVAAQKYRTSEAKVKTLYERISKLEAELEAVKVIADVSTFELPSSQVRSSEATAVALASDFHAEEYVDPSTVNKLNSFDLDIAHKRIGNFFANIRRLILGKQKSIKIKTLVLALLGDFISGNIHEEIIETTQIPPVEAAMWVQNRLASGIETLLKETNVKLVIPCHSGNHGRTTRTVHQATERGNSLEYFMYHSLANHFKDEKRITWIIAPGYHTHLDIAGFRMRLHHGHNLRYQGGVGGITIPVRKAIAQWNKAVQADLDCFGHFHQLLWCGNFVCNGALIGYNAYALSIKADFEKPKQAFFLIHHKRREVIDFCPVWLD